MLTTDQRKALHTAAALHFHGRAADYTVSEDGTVTRPNGDTFSLNESGADKDVAIVAILYALIKAIKLHGVNPVCAFYDLRDLNARRSLAKKAINKIVGTRHKHFSQMWNVVSGLYIDQPDSTPTTDLGDDDGE